MSRSLIIAAAVGASLALSPVTAFAGTKAATSLVSFKPATSSTASAPSASSLILGTPTSSASRGLPINNFVQNIIQRTRTFVNELLAKIFKISRGS